MESSDPAQFTNAIGNGKAQLTYLPLPAKSRAAGLAGVPILVELHYKDPYVQQWNLTIERDLGLQIGFARFQ